MVSKSVWAELDLPADDCPPPSGVGYTDTSGEDGAYDIGPLPPDTYKVFVWKDGYWKASETIELAEGDRVEKNWKLRLITETVPAQFFGYVTETLVSGEVKPLENALIRLIPKGIFMLLHIHPPHYAYYGYDRLTDANGYFEFDLLPLHGFYGVVCKSGYSDVKIGDTQLTEGESLQKDFTLKAPIDYAKITVEVTESTGSLKPGWSAIEDATLTLVESDGDVRTGHTNSWGYHVFDSVMPGAYVLSVTAEDYVSQSREGSVEPGAEIKESFQLKPSGEDSATLTGYVTKDMGFLDVWVPIEGATVSLAGVNTDEMPRITKTDSDGKYIFEEVSPREYDVTAQAEGFITETQRIMLEAGDEEYLSFALEAEEEAESGAVSGTVTAIQPNDETTPVAGLPVRLRAVSEDKNQDAVFEETTLTGLDGTYQFDEVPPGEYTLKVTVLFHDPLRATIEVIAGETTVQDFSFEVIPGAVTTGK